MSAHRFPIRTRAPLSGPYGPLNISIDPPAQGPTFGQLAHNAAAAAGRVFMAAAMNAPITIDDTARDIRRRVCQTCPGNWWRSDLSRCMHPRCGCFGRPKTALATESCPAGYWPR